ncbi:MAG: AmmeMemoRadiSam system radical SAM enzyme [Deltaproteobacteria bacterium]|nr:AmmeMemoRadiSam system radical SAM enzyme [Deltaproteobacteria bacterium]
MKAMLYESMEDGSVKCHLCAHGCIIKDGRRGICNVRKNRSGVLETLVYDKIIAAHVDPIEKKPLFHFHPGSLAFSIGTVGCNFRCRFCQNADIAQMATDNNGRIEGRAHSPEQLVDAAIRSGAKTIAYTYTEPTIFFELVYETARLAHEKGLYNVLVTNGYMTKAALDTLGGCIDGANVDLKAFSDDFYKKFCSARIEPVKETLRNMKKAGIIVEVTTLLIPGLNDDPDELKELASFIVSDLSVDTPWHVSRFHPTYKLTDRGPTPVESLMAAWRIGREAGLKYVYTGNVPGLETESTLCPGCGDVLISRQGFYVEKNSIRESACPKCGENIYGKGL